MKRNLRGKLIIVLILSVILLGAAVFRLYDLGEESLWLDECFTLDYSSQPTNELVETLKKDVHPIGYYIPQHLMLGYFGDSEFILRVLSVFFGVLSVYLTYLLGKKFFSWKEGLLAAFFMAISYTAILYSQEAKMYSMFGAFFLLSLYSFARFLERPSYLNVLFFSVSIALLLYTHIIGLIILACFILFYFTGYLFKYKKIDRVSQTPSSMQNLFFSRRFFLALLLIFLLYLPWFKMLMRYQLPRLYLSLGEKSVEKSGFNLLPFFSVAAVILVLLYFSGLYLFLKNKLNLDKFYSGSKCLFSLFNHDRIIFVLLLCFTLFDFLASKYFFSSVHIIRFGFFLLPLGYILFSRILLRMRRNYLANIIFAIFLISASLELYAYYHIDSKEQFREAAEYIENHASSADVLFLHRATIAKLCFDYYYSGNVEEARLITPGDDDYLLTERTSGKRDAYLILSHNYHTKDYFRQKLDSLYELVEEKKFIGVTIYKYRVSDD